MSKSKSSPRVFSRAFKLGIIRRMLAGEKRERLGAPAMRRPAMAELPQ